MKRANYLPAPAFFELNHACKMVNEAFAQREGVCCYLVGSSLENREYRDVDVRAILPDDEFDRLFPAAKTSEPHLDATWSLMCASLALWLQQRTGLPVDFQFQRRTQANEQHPDAERHALGIFLAYPGGG